MISLSCCQGANFSRSMLAIISRIYCHAGPFFLLSREQAPPIDQQFADTSYSHSTEMLLLPIPPFPPSPPHTMSFPPWSHQESTPTSSFLSSILPRNHRLLPFRSQFPFPRRSRSAISAIRCRVVAIPEEQILLDICFSPSLDRLSLISRCDNRQRGGGG